MTASLGGTTDAYVYNADGTKANGAGNVSYGASYSTANTIGIAMDLDAGQITFYKDNVSQGVAFTGITSASGWMFGYSCNGAVAAAVTINNGATAFTFTPPAGFAGMDAPPAASHGNAAVSLNAMTASGFRLAAGAVTLPAFTAVGGHNGLGAGIMQALTAAASGGPLPFGIVSFLPITGNGTGHSAAYSLSVMEPLTASGHGVVSGIIGLDAALPIITMSTTGFGGLDGALNDTLPMLQLQASTTGANLGLPLLTADGFLIGGSVSDGLAALPRLTLSAIASLNVPAAAGLTLPLLRLSTTGFSESLGTLLLDLPKMYLTSSGFIGNSLRLSKPLPLITLNAVGYGPYVGTADLSLFAPILTADGISQIAAAVRTWVLNVRKKGLTEYSNFDFNSYAEYQDLVLAAGDAGLVKLTAADKDATASIDAMVRTGAESFGTSYNKRVPRIYAGYSTTGDVHFSTYTSQDGKRMYLLPWNNITGVQQRRVPVGRGPKSPYWQFGVENVGGADFLLEHVQVYPEKTYRRVV
jgi:hypothetical protein